MSPARSSLILYALLVLTSASGCGGPGESQSVDGGVAVHVVEPDATPRSDAGRGDERGPDAGLVLDAGRTGERTSDDAGPALDAGRTGERASDDAGPALDAAAPPGDSTLAACARGTERVGDNCVEIDECARGLDDCAPGACVDRAASQGGWMCFCPPGYRGTGVGRDGCRDIDECTEHPMVCGLTTCTNKPGSFQCGMCSSGQRPDAGGACVGIDECSLGSASCPKRATCHDLLDGYRCECPPGTEQVGSACVDPCPLGTERVNEECLEVDECARSLDDCFEGACVNRSHRNGGFACVCPFGSQGSGIGPQGCHDIDECLTGANDCDSDPPACRNGSGSSAPFSCTCPEGFIGDGVGPSGCTPMLTGLSASPGTLEPALAPEHDEFRIKLPLAARELVLTPTAAANVEIRVAGHPVQSGKPSPPLALQAGENAFAVTVAYRGAERSVKVVVTRGDLDAFVKAPEPQSFSDFGYSVALASDLLVVGHHREDHSSLSEPGAAYVYVREQGGWRLLSRLIAPTPVGYGHFGLEVATDGQRVAVSATGEDRAGFEGAVYLFARKGQEIAFEARLTGSRATSRSVSYFGASLALRGDTLVVGAPLDDSAPGSTVDRISNSGAVYIFTDAHGWAERAYIQSSRRSAHAEFGSSLALGSRYLIVGAEDESLERNGKRLWGAGAAYVVGLYDYQTQFVIEAAIAGEDDHFGSSVAVSKNDGAIFVGAPGDSGSGHGVDPPHDDLARGAGAVYVFEPGGASGYIQTHYIKASNSEAFAKFGSSIALDGSQLLVGASTEDGAGSGIAQPTVNECAVGGSACRPGSGAAYLFAWERGFWHERGYFKATFPTENAYFGGDVALSEGTVAIGVENDSDGVGGISPRPSAECLNTSSASCVEYSGAVYLFR